MPPAVTHAAGIVAAPPRPDVALSDSAQSGHLSRRKWLWEVWRDDCRIRYFPTLEAAERYAHGYVAVPDERGYARRVTIHRNFHTVAEVRMDGAGRVWTDVIDGALA